MAIAVPTRDPKEATTLVNDQSAEARQFDKSVLPFPEPRRIRDRDYIRPATVGPAMRKQKTRPSKHKLANELDSRKRHRVTSLRQTL